MSSSKNSKRVLIVEGYSDKRFFQGLQRHIDLADVFDVRYPGDLRKHPGKVGAINTFGFWLEEAAEPGRYEAIGICVDADFLPDAGFLETDGQLKKMLADASFRMVDAQRRIYEHRVSGCRASFWIAPSHGSDGYLETLALQSLTDDELAYLTNQIHPYVNGIDAPRFEEKNLDRANLYVYLGIQRKPDKSLPTLMDDGKVDFSKQNMIELKNWLANLFGKSK